MPKGTIDLSRRAQVGVLMAICLIVATGAGWFASQLGERATLAEQADQLLVATGQIVDVEIKTIGRPRASSSYTVNVTYEYWVESAHHTSTRAWIRPPTYSSRDTAESAATSLGLVQGASIPVHHQADRPTSSLLFKNVDQSTIDGLKQDRLFSVVVMCLMLALAGCFAVAIARYK